MNIFNAPLPGTTLRTITEEWKVLSGFHALMWQRVKLEAEHLVQLHQLQNSIDLTWSQSGVWALISPVVDLWSSQMEILEECGNIIVGIVENLPKEPSPDEPEEGIIPYSRYDQLHGPYKAYQEARTAASSKESITEMQEWFQRNHSYDRFDEPLPKIDRNYRESVVVQRNILRPITRWHETSIPEKLEALQGYGEETQIYLRDYLAKFSKYTSEFVQSISRAQERIAKFSSLAFIDRSQKYFEDESSHPILQPAVYLNHYLGGAPSEPVLGVVSSLPKLLDVGNGYYFSSRVLSVRNFLEAERESTSFEETTKKLKDRFSFTQSDLIRLALYAAGPLLPLSDDAFRRHKNGIQRDEIIQLLKHFPIETCQMAATVIMKSIKLYADFFYWAGLIFGSGVPKQLLEDIWRKWDFDNHRPLPREVVRTLSEWNDDTNRLEGGGLIIKKSGLPYDLLK